MTDGTRKAAEATFKRQRRKDNSLKNVSAIEDNAVVDLGNRKVKLVARSGHTDSDVTVEVVDPKVIFCGDLFFNRMFPNYSNATPSKLEEYLKQISAAKDVTYIPGHGPVADDEAFTRYKQLLELVRESATRSFKAGDELAPAAKAFKLPESLSKWTIWSPQNVKLAYQAWYKELKK